jgi:RHH-type proline utilization regulon transcriptional repressor/proline dehydrogenase/delta 1-pyrroline-5-carboxylate dehydrogenase
VIAPWNFPLAISCGMASAAIVAGNCVVYKPSSLSPVTGHLLVDIFREAGLPPGVFNYVPCGGGGLGDQLVDHPDVALIAFTGSQDVGLRINERASKAQPGQRHIKKVITELGGKNAIIVDEDADIGDVAPRIIRSAFAFQGQKCSACSRVIVLPRVYDELLEMLVSAARSLRTGPPESDFNDIGPVIDAAAQARLLSYIDSPELAGRVAYRADLPDPEVGEGGFYVPVTVIGDVGPEDRVAQDELFGPVLSVMRARDFDHALDLAVSTPYALTGGVFSSDPERLAKTVTRFRVGNLYLNRAITGAAVGRQPFGGFGLSGGGTKAGGPDYLPHFMNPRVVTERYLGDIRVLE